RRATGLADDNGGSGQTCNGGVVCNETTPCPAGSYCLTGCCVPVVNGRERARRLEPRPGPAGTAPHRVARSLGARSREPSAASRPLSPIRRCSWPLTTLGRVFNVARPFGTAVTLQGSSLPSSAGANEPEAGG